MTPTLPITCDRAAYALLSSQLPAIDGPDALVAGACAIAMHGMGEAAEPGFADARLQGLAERVRGRVHGRQPQAVAAHLHDVLFGEEGYHVADGDYSDPAACYLPAVMDRKHGLPTVVGLIYKAVAERLGLRVWGVGVPGYFFCGLYLGNGPVYVNAYAGGQVLTAEEVYAAASRAFGGQLTLSADDLAPVDNRRWLSRILQSLLNLHGTEKRWADVAATLEMEMALWPREDRLHLDFGMVLAEMGRKAEARPWLCRYVDAHPEDPRGTGLRKLLAALEA